MLSLRTLARSAPRAAARFSAAPARSTLSRSPMSVSSRPLFQSQQVRQPRAAVAFSTAAVRCAPEADNEVDTELSAKLASEIQFETEIRENEPQATSVKDFLESGLFEVEDIPGREEVVLRRTYGNEKITVTFSIADLANYDPEMYEDDAALADEGEIEGEGRSGKQQQTSEGAEEEEDEMDGADTAAVPCRLSIIVEKPGKSGAGALSIEATAQDGGLMVDNLYYYADAALAHQTTPESQHAAQKVYPGPAFGSLDEDLQVLLDRFLEERGITQALAVFVPDYLDAKEQREYLGFLHNLKGFIDA